MPIEILSSLHVRPGTKDRSIAEAINDVNSLDLRASVEQLAVPRSYLAEPAENRRIGQFLHDRFQSIGYTTDFVGSYRNVFAYSDACKGQRVVLVCAHYDSVPGCPAADDNASAIAGQLALAEMVWNHFRNLPIAFVAVNREEDGLLGSDQFAEIMVREKSFTIAEVHNLEMIGFCSQQPGSQTLPRGIEIPGVTVGNFLALVGNEMGSETMREVILAGRTYVPDLPILGLQIDEAFANAHNDLLRSDHASFWNRGIKRAVQYTDTANFRNRNYHQRTDTPDTLDYQFHRQVVATVLATIITRAQQLSEG